MRILLLTQYYPPEPALKFADLARGLRERGHHVQVITGFPCYPAGKTYAGFRQRLFEEQQDDGVLVTRVPQLPDHSRSVIRRALYYLSFALSAATIGLWRMRRADVILVYQSALPTALSAWFISRVRRTPYVLDVADLWPESVAATGMLTNTLLLRLIRACMKFAYRGAAKVNVITEGYRDNLLALGVPREKLALIHYWMPSRQQDPVPHDEALARNEGLEGRFNVLYSGAIGPMQDLSVAVDAAGLIAAELPQVQFIIVGDGTQRESLASLVKERRAFNVRILGQRTPAEVQKYAAIANALLVHLKPHDLSRISIPSKTFACMASGRPILMAVEGESSRLIEQHGCGISIEPSNPQALAAAVRRLVAMPVVEREQIGNAGRQAFHNHYCSAVQIPKFERLLEETVHHAGNHKPNVDRRHSLKESFYFRRGKRVLDLAIALPSLLVFGPLMIIVALAVLLNLGWPVFFVQERPGRGGRLFELYKFRTMRDVRDSAGRLRADSERLSRFGRFLRATSLDELPELWNVIRGDMSLVGPRPLLPEYLERYTPQQARRHEVCPGITGWAQINGRNAIQWERKFEYDVQYIDRVSLKTDLEILFRTVGCVFLRRGVNAGAHCTMPPFTGTACQSDGAAA